MVLGEWNRSLLVEITKPIGFLVDITWYNDLVWLAVWNMAFMTFHSVGNNHSNWQAHIFPRGRAQPPTSRAQRPEWVHHLWETQRGTSCGQVSLCTDTNVRPHTDMHVDTHTDIYIYICICICIYFYVYIYAHLLMADLRVPLPEIIWPSHPIAGDSWEAVHRAALVVQSIAGSAEATEALGPERPPGAVEPWSNIRKTRKGTKTQHGTAMKNRERWNQRWWKTLWKIWWHQRTMDVCWWFSGCINRYVLFINPMKSSILYNYILYITISLW